MGTRKDAFLTIPSRAGHKTRTNVVVMFVSQLVSSLVSSEYRSLLWQNYSCSVLSLLELR